MTHRMTGRGGWAATAIAVALMVLAVAGAQMALAAARVVSLTDENRVGRLQVVMGNSETIKVALPFSEIVVGDPETADVSPLTDKTLYVLGKKLGMTNVTLFDTNKQVVAVIDIEVTHNLAGLKQALREGVPRANISLQSVNGRVLLKGVVPNAPAAERAMTIARDFAGDSVTNSLSIAANQQVNLEVRFIEASRQAGKDLGINWNLTDSNGEGLKTGNTKGPVLGALSGSLPFGSVIANILSNGVSADLVINALEERRLARRLAEPNLTALSGESASFLAGGEVPYRSCETTGSGATASVNCSVQFKPFGVQLAFTPVVLDDGLINLTINPEVSEINPAIGVEGNPGFITRKATTSVELRDGQSFAIAGLLQTVNEKSAKQVPWLGDVPILGALFRSSSFQKKESDLVIIVTPRLARPAGTLQALHTPLDNPISSNEAEFFLLGKQEVSKRELDTKYNGQYGFIIDLPGENYGAPSK